MPTIQWTCKVQYLSAPEDPHRLQASLSGLNAARIRMASDPDSSGRRTVHYLFKDQAFLMPARSGASRTLSETQVETIRDWIALRGALMNWSSTENWSQDDTDSQRWTRPSHPSRTLVAHIPQGSTRPVLLTLFRDKDQQVNGEVVRSLNHIEWQGDTPIRLVVESASGPIWNESEIRIQRGLKLDPGFFHPPDRRSGVTDGATRLLPIDAEKSADQE